MHGMDEDPVTRTAKGIGRAIYFWTSLIALPFSIWRVFSVNSPPDRRIVSGLVAAVAIWMIYRYRPAWISRRLFVAKEKAPAAQSRTAQLWFSAIFCVAGACFIVLSGPSEMSFAIWIGGILLFAAAGIYAIVSATRQRGPGVNPPAPTPDNSPVSE
jgi:hypothetical protein